MHLPARKFSFSLTFLKTNIVDFMYFTDIHYTLHEHLQALKFAMTISLFNGWLRGNEVLTFTKLLIILQLCGSNIFI